MAAGDEVGTHSSVPSAARTSGRLTGMAGALRLARAGRRHDRLILVAAPGLVVREGVTLPELRLAGWLLRRAFSAWTEVVVHVSQEAERALLPRDLGPRVSVRVGAGDGTDGFDGAERTPARPLDAVPAGTGREALQARVKALAGADRAVAGGPLVRPPTEPPTLSLTVVQGLRRRLGPSAEPILRTAVRVKRMVRGR
jgi:hypothetical protein